MINLLTLRLETITACPVCGGDDYEPHVMARWLGVLLRYYVCNNCGVMFLNPRMPDDQLAEYYAGMYRDELHVLERSEAVISARDIERQNLRAEMQMRLCAEFFEGCKTSLEIGCSIGSLMHGLAGIGISPTGIEPDERYHAVEPARRYKVYTDISACPPAEYDLICMSHSLEHLNHPLDYIRNLSDHYAHAGTRWMIEVPNGELNIVERPHHPFGFTAAALNWLMDAIGRKPMRVVYHNLRNADAPTYLLAVYGRARK